MYGVTLEEKISGVRYELETLKERLDDRWSTPADILEAFADFSKKLDVLILDVTAIEDTTAELEDELERLKNE